MSREYKPTRIGNGRVVFSISLPLRLYEAVIEYQKYIYNRNGIESNLSEITRSLIIKALKAEKAYEDELDNDEKDSGSK